MKKLLIGLILGLVLIFPLQVQAGAPLNSIQANVNRVLDVLRDPALKAESAKKTKEEKIKSIADNIFDFTALSKRTLGRNWRKLTRPQHSEFIDLYKAILEKAYIGRILAYTDEKVVFDKEIMLAKNKAEVRSHVITKSNEIPIFYKMIMRHGEWKVYDIIIEGVSLTKNYRTQFKEILLKKSPEQLLKIMSNKVKEQVK